MASEAAVRECLRHVVRAGYRLPPAMNQDPSGTVRTWMRAFHALDDHALELATRAWLESDDRGFFPKPGQIRSCATVPYTQTTIGQGVTVDAPATGAWAELRRRARTLAESKRCIDLLDQACAEAGRCDTYPGCEGPCLACSNIILRRADQLAQEFLDGPRTESHSAGADEQLLQGGQARPGPEGGGGHPPDGARGGA